MIKSTLNNHLIIAMPHLNDTIFNQSVILINDYSKSGAMGFILNKPMTSTLLLTPWGFKKPNDVGDVMGF